MKNCDMLKKVSCHPEFISGSATKIVLVLIFLNRNIDAEIPDS